MNDPSGQNENSMIIGIMSENKRCDDEDAFIQPITEKSLLLVGAYENNDIVYDPQWLFIIAIVAAFVILVCFIILIIYCFGKQKWESFLRIFVRYRYQNLKHQDEDKFKTLRAENICFDYLQDEQAE